MTLALPDVDPRRSATPTGLVPSDLAELDHLEKTALRDWHRGKAGDDDGRAWLPDAVRSLPLRSRLELALDVELDQRWEERERRRVRADVVYFTRGYGHVQPEVGDPIPFRLWPEQVTVLEAIRDTLRQIVLKARQLGLTWLALHYGLWLQAFCPETPRAKILGLSKHGEDAKKLLKRARRINSLLPPYLRLAEDPETRDSNSRFKLQGRGEMISLTGSPAAARQETATYAILDEFAFVKNKGAAATWTAVIATLGRRGKATLVSTGNGPAEVEGDGQAFAQLWNRAYDGDGEVGHMVPIFLPSDVDRSRDAAFYEARRREFLTEEDYQAEYAQTVEQALAGKQGTKVYPLSGVNAAVALGAELDGLLLQFAMAPPADELLAMSFDFGEYSHVLLGWPLEGGGMFIFGEVVGGGSVGMTVRELIVAAHHVAAVGQYVPEDDPDALPDPPLGQARYDAAGVESMRTVVESVESGREDPDDQRSRRLIERWQWKLRWSRRHQRKVATISTLPVPFGKPAASGRGAPTYKDETKDYARHLFNRAGAGERVGVLAIAAGRCPVLVRQLRGLELMDDGSGRIKKGDDHGPDSMLALLAPLAKAHRGLNPDDDVDLMV